MGFIHWWQAAGIIARATVLGTVFAGLTLLWSIATVFLPGDVDCLIKPNQGIAACGNVNVDGDVNLGVSQ